MAAPSDAGAHRAAYDRMMADLLRRAAARIAVQAEELAPKPKEEMQT
jgi:hypothetical protein